MKIKWDWAGHVCRMHPDRWAKVITDWVPCDGHRSTGAPRRRWRDDLDRFQDTRHKHMCSYPVPQDGTVRLLANDPQDANGVTVASRARSYAPSSVPDCSAANLARISLTAQVYRQELFLPVLAIFSFPLEKFEDFFNPYFVDVVSLKDWKITKRNCEECPRVYIPICAADNKTYTNECYLQCLNFRINETNRINKTVIPQLMPACCRMSSVHLLGGLPLPLPAAVIHSGYVSCPSPLPALNVLHHIYDFRLLLDPLLFFSDTSELRKALASPLQKTFRQSYYIKLAKCDSDSRTKC
ncbi:hypothetical protein MSG28_012757 [Choristoneura fumiferana]|uniref:Uncharacterized protein n=1 Tax=Choristoneura fumiferana TaxID=7141 RepID=A0ACC0JHT9_CHOFU|nr:hypothetical protein MSG28_012757 [Choristoneura fumiferana]